MKKVLLFTILVTNLGTIEAFFSKDPEKKPFLTKKNEPKPSQKTLPFTTEEKATPILKKEYRITTQASVIPVYKDNVIIIQITGIKTDSLNIYPENHGWDSDYIIIEDDNEKIARIQLNRYSSNLLLSVQLEHSDLYSQSYFSENVLGSMGSIKDFEINYSKKLQAVTIIIPFKFAPRKSLPITHKN